MQVEDYLELMGMGLSLGIATGFCVVMLGLVFRWVRQIAAGGFAGRDF